MGTFVSSFYALLPFRRGAKPEDRARRRPSARRRVGTVLTAAAVLMLIAADGIANPFVRLDYNLTLDIRSRDTAFIELFDDKPLTTTNFLQYVNADRYDNSIMHRLARNFVIQGGGFYPVFIDEPHPNVEISLDPNATVDLDGIPGTPNPTVNNEYSLPPIRSNLIGTISMARIGGQPNSATNQWFVNLNNNTGLDSVDGGFTVFARVVGDGMTLFNGFNSGLFITNLNPDVNDDGIRDGGPFFNNSNDGVPFVGNSLVVLQDAEQIDYYGSGLTTDVPAGGLPISTRDAFIDTGTIFTGTGPMTIGAGRKLGIRESYTLSNHSLTNHGTLAPGLQLGSITLNNANYLQFADGTLEIQLRETTPDTEHDRLVVNGAAFLGGKLDIVLLNNFAPGAGDSFTVLTASAGITGSFNSIDLPMLTPGLVWNLSQSLTAFTLSVAAADFNQDGVVDAADYVVWRKTDGSTAGYNLWRSNFGNVRGTVASGSGSLLASSVPEPSAILLIAISGWTLSGRRCSLTAIRRRQAA